MALANVSAGRKRKRAEMEAETERQEMTPFPLLDLPADILHIVLTFVRKEDRIWLARTCVSLYNSFMETPFLLQRRSREDKSMVFYTGVRSFATPIGRLQHVLESQPEMSVNMVQKAFVLALKQLDFQCAERLFLYNRHIFVDGRSYMMYAVGDGNLRAVEWLHRKGFEWDISACASAAKGGHLEVLKCARENGCPWDQWTCANAARWGHLDVLRYAIENGCPWNEWTCADAAGGGHLEVLKYARENGCPWDMSTCRFAAREGHLDVLKYARENGCPWDEDTCSYAARGGHLDVLKYARENGCPWDREGILHDEDVPDFIKEWVWSQGD